MSLKESNDTAIQAALGEHLRSVRLDLNLTRENLAAEVGLSVDTVRNAETGRNVSIETLIRLLRGLGQLDDLAALLAASHTLDAGRSGEAADRLVPLSDGAGPWRHMARELRGFAVFEGGGTVEAREIFSALVEDVATPPGVRNRAGELLSLINGQSG